LGRLGSKSAENELGKRQNFDLHFSAPLTPNRVRSASARTLMASCWRRSIAASTTREHIVLFHEGDYPHRAPSNSTSMPDPVELM
jgi:hypothetical protein